MGQTGGVSSRWSLGVAGICVFAGIAAGQQTGRAQSGQGAVTYYEDVLPVLQKRCLSCHVAGGAGAGAFDTYERAQPVAAAIRDAVKQRAMPPWFADAGSAELANDPRLSDEEIRIIETWVESGALPGKRPKQKRNALQVVEGISADLLMTAKRPASIAPGQKTHFQYVVFPMSFTYDRWVRAAEIRPSDRSVVDRAVLYVRDARSQWLRNVAPGVPAASETAPDPGTDILAIYTPEAPAVVFPEGTAKRVPSGADLVLQLRYTGKNTPASDQPQIGLVLGTDPPRSLLITVPMAQSEADSRSVARVLPADAMLISTYAHVPAKDVALEFAVAPAGGAPQTLLKVKPSAFGWHPKFFLKSPRMLRKGTALQWTVRSGDGGEIEGFFDIAVGAGVDRLSFLVR